MRKLISLFLLLGMAYGGGWYYFREKMYTQGEEWLYALRQKGYIVEHGGIKKSNNPLRAEVIIKDLQISKPILFKSWIAGDIHLGVQVWKPTDILAMVKGTYYLSNAFFLSGYTLKATGGQFKSLNFDPTHSFLAFDEISIIETSGKTPLVIQGFQMDLQKSEVEGQPKQDLLLEAKRISGDILTSVKPDLFLAPAIEPLRLQVNLVGVLDLKKEHLSEVVRTWYESNGVFNVSELTFKWGPLQLNIEGTVSLDEKLQPVAAFSLPAENLNSILDTLVQTHLIDRKIADLAQAGVQTVLTAYDQRISLSLQNRKLSLGQIEISEIPEVQWDFVTLQSAEK